MITKTIDTIRSKNWDNNSVYYQIYRGANKLKWYHKIYLNITNIWKRKKR